MTQTPLSSLPARGVWIEMLLTVSGNYGIESLPARGVWIEILCYTAGDRRVEVAPRKGSVD